MLDYQTLDSIADAYTPALAMLCLLLLIKSLYVRDWFKFAREGLLLVSGLFIAYGLMFIDNALALWPSIGLDYSTHTAVALVLVVVLSVMVKPYWLLWAGSLVCYALLMLYQQYHRLADIVTTALVVCALLLPLAFRVNKGNVQAVSKCQGNLPQ